MKRYNRFKMLNNIQDQYILESMPDYLELQAKKRRGNSPIIRFFNSGWGVACICALVAVSVMVFIIQAGRNPWTPPGSTIEETELESPTVEATEAPTEAPTEADTTPYFDPATLDIDTYQGMTPDIPYTIHYLSYGDGTCAVNGITINILYEGDIIIDIPETSPEGDTVLEMFVHSTYNIPAYLLAEDFEKIQAAALAYYDGDDENFYYKQFMSYFGLYSADLAETPEQREKYIASYPLCEYVPVYVFDPTATSTEWMRRSQDLAAMAPWYTAEWCYYDIVKAKTVADSMGVTDSVLEDALAKHSGSFENVSEIKIPKTLRSDGWSALNLWILSDMGIKNLTFNGTMAEMSNIANPEEIVLSYPLVIHCTDGDLTYSVAE